MAFTGDLSKLPLADVFQSIHQNTMTGALVVRDPNGERLIGFDKGFVFACTPTPNTPQSIGEELVRRQVVQPEAVRPSRIFRRKGQLHKALAKHGLEEERFKGLVRSVVLERLYDVFLMETGNFEFLEEYDAEAFDLDEVGAGIRIRPDEILMEAMRRIDEWKRLRRNIPSFKEVYIPTREATEDDPPLVQVILHRTAQETVDLESLLDALPYPRFQALEALGNLLGNGLRVATAPEYLELGRAAEGRGDMEAAAGHYQRGLAYERGNADMSGRLIDVLVRQDKGREAADVCKLHAGVLLEQGDRAAAARLYAQAAELAPTDPLPRERLYDLQLEDRDADAARHTAAKLVEVYLKLGLGEKAKAVYPRLLRLQPRDRALRESLAEVHEALNELEPAAWIYKELGKAAADRGDEAEALELLGRAVQLHPDEQAHTLLRDLESGELARRKQRRRRYVVFTIASVILGLIGWQVAREVVALEALRVAEQSLHVADAGPVGVRHALEAYERVGNLHPDSYAAEWAAEGIRGLTPGLLRHVERSARHMDLGPARRVDRPAEEVVAALEPLLHPRGGDGLGALIREAERAVERGEQWEARVLLAEAWRRIEDAKWHLATSSPQALRFDTALITDQRELHDWIPRAHLAMARAWIRSPEVIEAVVAAQKIYLQEAAPAEESGEGSEAGETP